SGQVIDESVESNNDAQYRLSLRGDPAFVGTEPFPSKSGVSAILLNSSGVANVEVDVQVANLGNAPLTNLPVNLEQSRNGGPFTPAGSITIPQFLPGDAQILQFITNGFAGDTIYRAFFDPSASAVDSNLSNNSGTSELIIQGLADLTVGSLALSKP